MKTCLPHHRKQADRFQGYCLTTGIGTGNDNHGILFSHGNINGHNLFCINQRMTSLLNRHAAILGKFGSGSHHTLRQLSSCENKIQLCQSILVVSQVINLRGKLLGKVGKYFFNFFFFPNGKFTQFVVKPHHFHRFNEGRGPCRRLVVHHTADLILVFAAVRQTIPTVPHGNQRILQHTGCRSLIYNRTEAFMNLIMNGLHLTAHAPKSRAGIVRHFLFGEDAALNLMFHRRQRNQHREGFRQGIALVLIGILVPVISVILRPKGCRKQGTDPQKLCHGQCPAPF